MESTNESPSVILKLMGLEKVPYEDAIRDKQKVLSEDYWQKVASIGIRKKRSSYPHHSFGMITDEKEESVDDLKVVKIIRRDKQNNPSKGNRRRNPYLMETKVKALPQRLMDASYLSVDKKPETLVNTLSDALLQEISCPKNIRLYPEISDKRKMSRGSGFNEQSSRSFSKISENVSTQMVKATTRVLDTVSGRNEAFSRSSDMLKPALNIVANEPRSRGFGVRNVNNQSGFSHDKVKMNTRFTVAMKCSHARKMAINRSLRAASVIAYNHRATTKDNFLEKYWGLRKNASANRSTQKSKNQSTGQKDCLEDMNLRSSSKKSASFSSCFNNNHVQEKCIDLQKSKTGNDFSDKEPRLPEFLQETCLMDGEGKNNELEDINMHIMSPNSSVNDILESDAKVDAVIRSYSSRTMLQSESAAFDSLPGDSDSLSHSSYASTQPDASEFQEDSTCSLFSGTEPDSLGSFEGAYEPSPVSVLVSSFREGILSSLKVVDEYDSSELDDEGFGLNVSSDEDSGDESISEPEEKKNILGLFGSEESRNFSYVVDILTEAGISNRSLFTNFSTWHYAEYPISPSIFDTLEKKFGDQKFWRRSERRLLFDRINTGLSEILLPWCSYVPTWEKPVSRRLNSELSQSMVEEEIWGMLVSEEKKAKRESEDSNMLGGEISWIELGEDIEVIVIEIVKLLIEELADEVVSF